mgnify:CR=1 FL=1
MTAINQLHETADMDDLAFLLERGWMVIRAIPRRNGLNPLFVLGCSKPRVTDVEALPSIQASLKCKRRIRIRRALLTLSGVASRLKYSGSLRSSLVFRGFLQCLGIDRLFPSAKPCTTAP